MIPSPHQQIQAKSDRLHLAWVRGLAHSPAHWPCQPWAVSCIFSLEQSPYFQAQGPWDQQLTVAMELGVLLVPVPVEVDESGETCSQEGSPPTLVPAGSTVATPESRWHLAQLASLAEAGCCTVTPLGSSALGAGEAYLACILQGLQSRWESNVGTDHCHAVLAAALERCAKHWRDREVAHNCKRALEHPP